MTTSGPPRLRVGVIGVGRVGSVLGAALQRVGHHVAVASAVSELSLARAAAMLPNAAIVDPPDVLAQSDLVLLTVPDDVLDGLVRGLVQAGAVRTGQLLLHCSGRHGVAVLQPATDIGAIPLAVHPVMTFTGTSLDLQRLPDAPFAVTAPHAALPIAQGLVVEMGGDPFIVAEEARPLYHAALAHGANHLAALVSSSFELLQAAGVSDPRRATSALLQASLDNAMRLGGAALTGPVARGDVETVRAHIAAIARVSPAAADAYVVLARMTADRAIEAGLLKPTAAEQLLGALASARSR